MSSLPDGIRVTYRGTVGWSEVLGVLAQHDVLFLPTRGENFGHVIVEALAAGCPPLISDQSPWDVASRRAGWNIGLDEPERFAETLTRLLETEDREFRGFRKRAREYAEEISASSVARRANRELFMSPPHERRERSG
jgi:glycosyltransferase involved in cell wall biosynthesis